MYSSGVKPLVPVKLPRISAASSAALCVAEAGRLPLIEVSVQHASLLCCRAVDSRLLLTAWNRSRCRW